jgi:hypothetical protein
MGDIISSKLRKLNLTGKSSLSVVCGLLLLITLCISVFPISVAQAATIQGWEISDRGGYVNFHEGVFVFAGNEISPGPTLYKQIAPQDNFTISLQVKAATLGEVNRNPDGAGEGFALILSKSTDFVHDMGVSVELRARGGGQFTFARQTLFWHWDWTPFIYNTLENNNGYDFWHNSPSNVTENAPVKPNVWYTINLEVQKEPFKVTAEVMDENGTLLGAFSPDDMVNFTFEEIKYIGMESLSGGQFFVQNITGITSPSEFTFSPSKPTTYNPVVFKAAAEVPNYGTPSYVWDFGDTAWATTTLPQVSHSYLNAGVYNVTLTLTNALGTSSSTTKTIEVKTPTYLSLSADASITMGTIVNISGRLFGPDDSGLINQPVVVTYSLPGSNITYPISSAYTDDRGKYGAQWIPQATGTFLLNAQWAGNQTYTQVVNTTTLSSLPPQNGTNAFFLESNSTITALAFNSTSAEVSFTVTGPSGTTGYTKLALSKDLVTNASEITTQIDGREFSYALTETNTTWILTFNYNHSSHTINVHFPANVELDAAASAVFAESCFVTTTEGSYLLWAALGMAAIVAISGKVISERKKK